MSSMVLSVERITITISGTATTGSTDVTLGQDLDNCVFFLSKKTPAGSSQMSQYQFAVYQSDFNTWTAERSGTTDVGTTTIEGYCVEFDPARVKVQQGSGTLPAIDNDIALAEAVSAATDCFVLHNHRHNFTGVQYGRSLPRFTGFKDTSTLQFSRSNTTGTPTLYYFLAESLDGGFSVEHGTHALGSGNETGSVDLTATIDITASFLITSALAVDNNDDWEDICHRAWLTSTSGGTVNFSRANGGVSSAVDISIGYQVVTFDSAEGILVQRVDIAITGTSNTGTLGTAVDLDHSSINPTTYLGIGEGDSTDGTELGNFWAAAVITNTTTVTATVVSDTTTNATYHFEVIDWNITSGAPPIEQTLTAQVEILGVAEQTAIGQGEILGIAEASPTLQAETLGVAEALATLQAEVLGVAELTAIAQAEILGVAESIATAQAEVVGMVESTLVAQVEVTGVAEATGTFQIEIRGVAESTVTAQVEVLGVAESTATLQVEILAAEGVIEQFLTAQIEILGITQATGTLQAEVLGFVEATAAAVIEVLGVAQRTATLQVEVLNPDFEVEIGEILRGALDAFSIPEMTDPVTYFPLGEGPGLERRAVVERGTVLPLDFVSGRALGSEVEFWLVNHDDAGVTEVHPGRDAVELVLVEGEAPVRCLVTEIITVDEGAWHLLAQK